LKIKSNPFHEVRLYIGSLRGYKGAEFTKDELIDFIHEVQAEAGADEAGPVRVTATEFVWGAHDQRYREPGWEIAVINYPR